MQEDEYYERGDLLDKIEIKLILKLDSVAKLEDAHKIVKDAIRETRRLHMRTCYIRDNKDKMCLAIEFWSSLYRESVAMSKIYERISVHCEVSADTARRWCDAFKNGYDPRVSPSFIVDGKICKKKVKDKYPNGNCQLPFECVPNA